jgi:hypothetical protein
VTEPTEEPRRVVEQGAWRTISDWLPERTPPIVLWALLIAAAALLIQIVEPGSVESPYTGF